MNKKIKVGDFIYRIYPSGHKSPGIAASIIKGIGMGFPYRWNDNKLKWDAFFALENYEEDGIDMSYLYDGYGKGSNKYKYTLIPKKELSEYKSVIENMKNVPYLSEKNY